MVEKPIKKEHKFYLPTREELEDQQTKDNHTKELINQFLESCDYFKAMHSERQVFPSLTYLALDHRVKSLLELYERQLPYLMRNPDCKFQTADTYSIASEDIILGINRALCLEDESTEDVNIFIAVLLVSWRNFKLQNKGSK